MRKRQRELSPLSTLLQQLSLYSSDIPVDHETVNSVLSPHVQKALAHESGAGPLLQVLQQFGWKGFRFTHDVHLERMFLALQVYKYERLQSLGSGTYATVYKARNRETKELCAVKKMRLSNDEPGVPNTAIREISCLKDLAHPNIVELKDVLWLHSKAQMYLILECLDCDLREHLNRTPGQAPETSLVKDYMYQMLKALAFAHSRRVMHRDLKPQNILIDSSQQSVKIADFGLARTFLPLDRAYSQEVVTLWYRAPELLLGTSQYTTAVDMWSMGCILAEMLNFLPIFSADSEIGMLHQIFQVTGTPNADAWSTAMSLPYFRATFPKWSPKPLAEVIPSLASDPSGADLLSRLLTLDPAHRISASQALQHPWFLDCPQHANVSMQPLGTSRPSNTFPDSPSRPAASGTVLPSPLQRPHLKPQLGHARPSPKLQSRPSPKLQQLSFGAGVDSLSSMPSPQQTPPTDLQQEQQRQQHRLQQRDVSSFLSSPAAIFGASPQAVDKSAPAFAAAAWDEDHGSDLAPYYEEIFGFCFRSAHPGTVALGHAASGSLEGSLEKACPASIESLRSVSSCDSMQSSSDVLSLEESFAEQLQGFQAEL